VPVEEIFSKQMSTESQAADQFLDSWIQEFGRAIEMFSGEQATVTYSRTKELAASESHDLLWWNQAFEGSANFSSWIGAKENTWMTLGGAPNGVDGSDAKNTYREIIEQAQQGTATVISGGLPQALRCRQGGFGSGPEAVSVFFAIVGVKLSSGELPAIVLAVDRAIAQIGRTAIAIAQPAKAAGDTTATPMLERLMDLELPLSVALGRTEMPIRDVLKVTSGSVIELERTVGDYVELIVHGTVVARGEVVSVKGNYGIRIREIISKNERISLYGRN
jgi:flagellar motor switch protein FliN/FliY